MTMSNVEDVPDDVVLNVSQIESCPNLLPSVTALQVAAERCSAQYAYAPIHGRGMQCARLHGFWNACVEQRRGGFLYVSGRPGCGKSATVRAAMRVFKSQYPRADTAFVNCVELARGPSSRGQLASLLTALHANNKRANGATAGNDELLRRFSTRNKEILVALDEMDQLDVKTLYDVIKSTVAPNSRLVVVGIANSLDFVERWLPDIVGPTPEPPLVFDAYDEASIFGIIDARVGPVRHTHRLLSDAAVRLCATRAAKLGDARDALQYCRTALEELRARVESDGSLVLAAAATGRYAIDIREMSDVIARVSGPRNPTGSVVAGLSLPDKLVLFALFRSAGEVSAAHVLQQYSQLCVKHNHSERSSPLVLQSLELLADAGLAVLTVSSNVWNSKVALKVSPADVEAAFRNERTLKSML